MTLWLCGARFRACGAVWRDECGPGTREEERREGAGKKKKKKMADCNEKEDDSGRRTRQKTPITAKRGTTETDRDKEEDDQD